MEMRVKVPRWPNRLLPGVVKVLGDDGKVLFSAPCLARSDSGKAASEGNKSRDPLHRFGDLPAGQYLARVEPHAMLPQRTYGPHRPIRLLPRQGPAAIAARNGRDGLLQHGGVLSKAGKLRPTFGCVRVTDEAQFEILAILDAAGVTELPYHVVEI